MGAQFPKCERNIKSVFVWRRKLFVQSPESALKTPDFGQKDFHTIPLLDENSELT